MVETRDHVESEICFPKKTAELDIRLSAQEITVDLEMEGEGFFAVVFKLVRHEKSARKHT